MNKLKYKLVNKGAGFKHGCPIDLALVDIKDINEVGLSKEEAIQVIAEDAEEAVAMNVFDLDVLTTTSDGLVIEGAIIMFAAADKGKVHPEFGCLPVKKMEVNEEMINREPHSRLAQILYPGKPIYRGADYDVKKVPIHNSVMSGRAINNNSGTEIMDAVSMEELLCPITGQLQLMKEEKVLIGLVGHEISASLGLTILEDYSRSQPYMKCKPGDTAHGSGKYAKNLKAHLPVIVPPKKVLAKHILTALNEGLRPARELAASPALLLVTHYLGLDFPRENVTKKAREELISLNIDVDEISKNSPKYTPEEVIEKADEIIPGVDQGRVIDSNKIIEERSVEV